MALRLAACCLYVLIFMIVARNFKLYTSVNGSSDGFNSRRHVGVRLCSGQVLSDDFLLSLIRVVRTSSKSKRERWRLSAPISYYANSSATFRSDLRLDRRSWSSSHYLLVCGDIEVNPGPSTSQPLSSFLNQLHAVAVDDGQRYVNNDVTNDVVTWPTSPTWPTTPFVYFVLPGGLTVYQLMPVVLPVDLFEWRHCRRPTADVIEKLAIPALSEHHLRLISSGPLPQLDPGVLARLAELGILRTGPSDWRPRRVHRGCRSGVRRRLQRQRHLGLPTYIQGCRPSQDRPTNYTADDSASTSTPSLSPNFNCRLLISMITVMPPLSLF
jgi:hypothetical protein